MSEKIRDFLNELEQKDKNVDDITDINIGIELNAERKRERNKKINLKLDKYFPDKGMFFYNRLEIYCIEKKLNYENIKNSNYPFFKYLYAVKSSIKELNTEILIGNLKDCYFSSSRECAFSRCHSFIIPFAYYHFGDSHIIDIKASYNKAYEEMSISIVEYDGFKIVSGAGCANCV